MDIYLTLDHIINVLNSFWEVYSDNSRNYRGFKDSFYSEVFDYRHGLMSVTSIPPSPQRQHVEITPRSEELSISLVTCQIKVSFIQGPKEKFLSPCEATMLSHYHKDISAIFKCNNRFNDQMQSMLTYSQTMGQQYNAPFFSAHTSDVADHMDSAFLCSRQALPFAVAT